MIDYFKLKHLVELGYSNSEIADIVALHRTTVAKWIKRHRLQQPKTTNCIICGNMLKNSRRLRCDSCNTKLRRFRAKLKAVNYLGGKCSKCGYEGNLAAFDFHHINPVTKKFNPNAAESANRSWKDVKEELDKCVLLCANCHRLEHNDYDNELFLKIALENHCDLIFKED